MLADHRTHEHLSLGPLHANASVGSLLELGIALALVRLLLAVAISFLPARISDTTQARLRSELFAAFSEASWAVQSQDREGHFQELLTNQTTQATLGYAVAAQFVVALITFGVLVASAVAVSPVAAVGIIVIVGGVSFLLRPLANMGHRRAEALSQGWMAYAGGVNEAVRLAEEAHIFGVEGRQRAVLDRLVADFRGPNLQTNWLGNLVTGVYQAFIYLVLLAALAALHAVGTGHLAELGVVVLMLVRSGAYGQQVQSSIQSLRQSQPYVERVRKAATRYRASAHPEGAESLERVDEIAFREVSFAYEGNRSALSGVDFTVARGEAIGIVGPSGAGKSTLVQLLLGLRAPNSGDYLVNRVPALDITRSDWHRVFAYVPQEPRLLHASVADNIRFFRDLSDESVVRAAQLAGIHDEISGWPSGYSTVVGPRADAISGGQQQRICLARALAANPEVLVLDEPTSALDPLAEQTIQESLVRLKDHLTLFIVAHRLSTLDICDRVMVVVQGKLEAFAPVDELFQSNPYYRSAVSTNKLPAKTPKLSDGEELAQLG